MVEWIDGVWALSASKQDEDYGIEHGEEDKGYYGYRSREERAATAAEPRRAAPSQAVKGCGAQGSSPPRAREPRNLQMNEHAGEGRPPGLWSTFQGR